MSERLKYSNNGVYKIENFEQHLATGQFPKQFNGPVSWIFGPYITLKIREEYNQLYPYIVFDFDRKRKVRAFFNIKSKFWSLCYKTEGSIYLESGQGVSGPTINIQDVLNEENGYLENGTLTVEYGVHVDAVIGNNNIWTFNLSSKLFNSEQEHNAITIKNEFSHVHFTYYSPKPLLVFHKLKEIIPKARNEIFVRYCLQIGNGVRLKSADTYPFKWFCIAEVGQQLNMMNVIRYCDIILIQTTPRVLKIRSLLKTAIKLNMRQCAPRMIELWNFKKLLEELEDCLDEIPGEMMKVITKKFIDEEL